LGQRLDRGFLSLAGRSYYLIITTGYNVYPQVVDRVVNVCPGLRASALFGISVPMRGERVAAFVERYGPGLDYGGLNRIWGDRHGGGPPAAAGGPAARLADARPARHADAGPRRRGGLPRPARRPHRLPRQPGRAVPARGRRREARARQRPGPRPRDRNPDHRR